MTARPQSTLGRYSFTHLSNVPPQDPDDRASGDPIPGTAIARLERTIGDDEPTLPDAALFSPDALLQTDLPPRPARPAVTEERLRVSGVDAIGTASEAPPHRFPDRLARVHELIRELEKCAPGDEAVVIPRLRTIGIPAVLPDLENAFPGLLWFHRTLPHRKRPAGRDCGPLFRVLHDFGEPAVPAVARLLTLEAPHLRWYAALLAGDLGQPAIVPALGELILDEDEEVRELSIEMLWRYRASSEHKTLRRDLHKLAMEPANDVRSRLLAVRALGVWRDPQAVDVLVSLLTAKMPLIAKQAHRTLLVLTGHDLGADAKPWRSWLEAHRDLPRIAWLIDGLEDPSLAVRAIAVHELVRTTGVDLGFLPGAAPEQRAEAVGRYRAWWAKAR